MERFTAQQARSLYENKTEDLYKKAITKIKGVSGKAKETWLYFKVTDELAKLLREDGYQLSNVNMSDREGSVMTKISWR